MKDIELSNRMEESLEMLHALNEEGLMIMPIVPNEAMVQSAKKVCDLSESEIRKLYFAMATFADTGIPVLTN